MNPRLSASQFFLEGCAFTSNSRRSSHFVRSSGALELQTQRGLSCARSSLFAVALDAERRTQTSEQTSRERGVDVLAQVRSNHCETVEGFRALHQMGNFDVCVTIVRVLDFAALAEQAVSALARRPRYRQLYPLSREHAILLMCRIS